MRKRFTIACVIALATVMLGADAWAKSVVRSGEPILTFNRIVVPETLKQGQFFQISAEMTAHKNIWENMDVFLHFVDPKTNKVIINNDFGLSIPATAWTPGETVVVGPVNCYIPEELPPGTYNIQMGLFSSRTTREGSIYTREPYTNPEIKNFVVLSVKVEAGDKTAEEKIPDLIISGFETISYLKKWQLRQCKAELAQGSGLDGKNAARMIIPKGTGGTPGMILESFFNYCDPKYCNWSEYDVIQFYVYCDPDENGSTALRYPVTLQVKDKSGTRFQQPLPMTQDKGSPFSMNLSQIGSVVDLMNVGNLTFFTTGSLTDEDLSIYIDDIKVISLGYGKRKKPSVKFEGLKLNKEKVKAGESIELQPSFSTTVKFSDEYNMFIHIYRRGDKAGWINADTNPSPPTTDWELNQVIAQGPYSIFIPETSPSGKYDVEIGLFLTKEVSPGEQYVKYHRDRDGIYYIEQPAYPTDIFKVAYSNYSEYGDWVVGSFEVEAP